MKEAMLLCLCSHNNLVRFIGICIANETPELVLALEKTNLKSYLSDCHDKIVNHENTSQSIALWNEIRIKLLSYCHQVANGMYYLTYEKRMIHRDLALRNVLLSKNHIIKITDFGLAKMKPKDTRAIAKEDKVGGIFPIKWMAPESIERIEFTHATDVWSFGITCWEILMLGGQPWHDVTSQKDLLKLMKDGARLKQPKLLSLEVWIVLLHCWDIHPERRPEFTTLYTNFEEFAKDPNRFISKNWVQTKLRKRRTHHQRPPANHHPTSSPTNKKSFKKVNSSVSSTENKVKNFITRKRLSTGNTKNSHEYETDSTSSDDEFRSGQSSRLLSQRNQSDGTEYPIVPDYSLVDQSSQNQNSEPVRYHEFPSEKRLHNESINDTLRQESERSHSNFISQPSVKSYKKSTSSSNRPETNYSEVTGLGGMSSKNSTHKTQKKSDRSTIIEEEAGEKSEELEILNTDDELTKMLEKDDQYAELSHSQDHSNSHSYRTMNLLNQPQNPSSQPLSNNFQTNLSVLYSNVDGEGPDYPPPMNLNTLNNEMNPELDPNNDQPSYSNLNDFGQNFYDEINDQDDNAFLTVDSNRSNTTSFEPETVLDYHNLSSNKNTSKNGKNSKNSKNSSSKHDKNKSSSKNRDINLTTDLSNDNNNNNDNTCHNRHSISVSSEILQTTRDYINLETINLISASVSIEPTTSNNVNNSQKRKNNNTNKKSPMIKIEGQATTKF